jgi:glutamine cyclotransferase
MLDDIRSLILKKTVIVLLNRLIIIKILPLDESAIIGLDFKVSLKIVLKQPNQLITVIKPHTIRAFIKGLIILQRHLYVKTFRPIISRIRSLTKK